MIKTCKRCNEEKSYELFPKDRATKVRGDYCRACKTRMYVRAWQIKYPERRAAHREVWTALKHGTVKRPNKCEWCGKDGYTIAHHGDYTKPLEVDWICDKCHMIHHKGSSMNGLKGGRPKRTYIAQSLAIGKPEHTLGASDVKYNSSDLPRRCQASHCDSYNTTQKELAGCKVWLCDFHPLPI